MDARILTPPRKLMDTMHTIYRSILHSFTGFTDLLEACSWISFLHSFDKYLLIS